jgi:Arc/MetJ-type ribon-helix-helix transcriptional regulator
MNAAKIAISIEPALLRRVDSLVSQKRFRSRSELFQIAVAEQIERLDEDALSRQCAKLDPVEERAFADMGLTTDLTEWPAY